jgi:single-stranded-DNA-specific exonuclease
MSTSIRKRWQVAPRITDGQYKSLGVDDKLVAQLLVNRGITNLDQAQAFLSPRLGSLHDPMLFDDMPKAVARVREAVEHDEHITIFGDYDADGICSTALLYETIRSFYPRVSYYIPERIEEGYGLNREAIELLAHERDTRLMITVDCGISNKHEIEIAKKSGIDVIVTDHHHVPEELPPAVAILDPKVSSSRYPFKDLAGVGIAFKLAKALTHEFGSAGRYHPFDLVALATVADIAPLIDENRVFVTYGLQEINKGLRPGIRALISAAGFRCGEITTGHIGFQLAPRLNASGRISHAHEAVALLLSTTDEEAQAHAEHLSLLNQERQDLTERIFQQAFEQASTLGEQKLYFLRNSGWPAGIVGLVAGKLSEQFYRPVVVVEEGKETSKGSARSIKGFHITEALSRHEHLLERFGGHELAAGFEVANEQLDKLENGLLTTAEQMLSPELLMPLITIDRELNLADIDWSVWKTVERLAPYGFGNTQPLFVTHHTPVRVSSLMGREQKHLKIVFGDARATVVGVGFGMADRIETIVPGDRVDIVYSIDKNEWNREQRLQIRLKDIRQSNSEDC